MIKKSVLLLFVSALIFVSCKKEVVQPETQVAPNTETKGLFDGWSSKGAFNYKKAEYKYSQFPAAIQTLVTNMAGAAKTSDIEKSWNASAKYTGQSMDKSALSEYQIIDFFSKTNFSSIRYQNLYTPMSLSSREQAYALKDFLQPALTAHSKIGVIVFDGKNAYALYKSYGKFYVAELNGSKSKAREMSSLSVSALLIANGQYGIQIKDAATQFSFAGRYVAIFTM